jgi:integrase/recombinase XerD
MSKHAKILDEKHSLSTVLNALNSTRERVMVLLSIKAGLRAVEIAHLTWGCIRESDSVIELQRTKGGKARTVPVNKDLRKALREYRAEVKRTGDDDYLFKNRHTAPSKPLTPNAIAQWFRDLYGRRLGWEGFSSHSGRRNFGTQAARNAVKAGGSLRDVQDLLGHASLATTQKYLEPSSNAKLKLVDLV